MNSVLLWGAHPANRVPRAQTKVGVFMFFCLTLFSWKGFHLGGS